MNITYWSDFVCPFCYIGETNLKRALDEINLDDITLNMKAFELNPTIDKNTSISSAERYTEVYGISLEEAAEKAKNINQIGKDNQLDFDFTKARHTNTFDAHRLMKYFQKNYPDLTERLSERIFEAFFKDNKVISDHEVLAQIAQDLGVEVQEIKEFLKTNQLSAEVLTDELEAAKFDIYGVPYFIVNNQYAIPGSVTKDGLKQILLEIEQSSNSNEN